MDIEQVENGNQIFAQAWNKSVLLRAKLGHFAGRIEQGSELRSWIQPLTNVSLTQILKEHISLAALKCRRDKAFAMQQEHNAKNQPDTSAQDSENLYCTPSKDKRKQDHTAGIYSGQEQTAFDNDNNNKSDQNLEPPSSLNTKATATAQKNLRESFPLEDDFDNQVKAIVTEITEIEAVPKRTPAKGQPTGRPTKATQASHRANSENIQHTENI